MSDNSSNNKRIAKNTFYMYIRMVVVMAVTLYTSRIVLQLLGVEDFGIYNVVGGIIAMFRILNGALTDASQRFITFELGKGEEGNVSKVFSQCIILHVLLGIAVVIVAEPVGVWFMNNKLMIPPERLNAAFWIYQFTVISMFVMFISVPYNALIVAHEKMKAFAAISIVDALLRLIVAFALYIEGVDKLILYGALMLLTQLFLRSIYTYYCKRNIQSSTFKFTWDKNAILEMGKFASWTIVGNMAYLATTQGVNLLLGMFFNPVVNAAKGIASQIQGAVESFVRNFQTAINPQITKRYASGQIDEMQNLVFTCSRLSFFLMMIPILPLLFETKYVLQIWLGQVPEYSIEFTRITLIISWITALLNPLEVSVKASGRIKNFELAVYGAKLLLLPIAYGALCRGSVPIAVFKIQLFLEFFAFGISVYVTSKGVGFSIKNYLKDVVLMVIPVILVSTIIPIIVVKSLDESIGRFVLLTSLSVIWSLLTIVKIGTNKTEKIFIKNKIPQKKWLKLIF